MNDSLRFYEVNVEYINYLKRFDAKVPDVVYQTHEKFLCGVLFKIHGLNYFAPVSSFNRRLNSNFVIYLSHAPVGSIRFSFMIPVPDQEVSIKRISAITDDRYRFFLKEELNFCNYNREAVKSAAFQFYKEAVRPYSFYHNISCDFRKLEKKCKEWIMEKALQRVKEGMHPLSLTFQEKVTLAQISTDELIVRTIASDSNPVIHRQGIAGLSRLKQKSELTKEDTMCYLSVYPCKAWLTPADKPICRIADTPENTAAFIMRSTPDSRYAFVDEFDKIKAFSNGNFLGLVPDKAYFNELLPAIQKMQFGEAKVPEVQYINETAAKEIDEDYELEI